MTYAALNVFCRELGAAAGIVGTTGYSLRRGGATALASAGVGVDAIRLAGRWGPRSFCVWRYCDQTLETSAGLAQSLVQPLTVLHGGPAGYDVNVALHDADG